MQFWPPLLKVVATIKKHFYFTEMIKGRYPAGVLS